MKLENVGRVLARHVMVELEIPPDLNGLVWVEKPVIMGQDDDGDFYLVRLRPDFQDRRFSQARILRFADQFTQTSGFSTRIPATLLGRLARDRAFRGRGIGNRLMADALARALAGSAEIGSFAVVTNPKDERAAAFYQGFGFIRLNDRRLILPMKAVARLLQERQA